LLVSVKHSDPHPQEEDSNESNNKNQKECDCDPDESGSVNAQGVIQAVCIDHHLFFILS